MKKIILIVLAVILLIILFVIGLYLTSPSTLTPDVGISETQEPSSGSSGFWGGLFGSSGGQSVGVTPTSPGSSLPVSTTTETSPINTTSVTTASGTPMTTKNFLDVETTLQDAANADYYYLAGSAPAYAISTSTSPTETSTSTTVSTVPDTAQPIISAMSASVGGKPYLITYTQSASYFNITLLQEPVGAMRAAAERELQSELGIDQSAMCNLNYTVAVPWSVNETFSGMDLGFSFCPGAVKLPN